MRHTPWVHADHLAEAVRVGVLSADQREALEAIARAMPADGRARRVDVEVFRLPILGAVSLALLGLAVVMLDAFRGASPRETGALALGGMAVLLGLLQATRGRGLFEPTRGALVAAAVGLVWPLVASWVAGGDDRSHVDAATLARWGLPADAALCAVAVAVALRWRAPTVIVPMFLAMSHALVRVTEVRWPAEVTWGEPTGLAALLNVSNAAVLQVAMGALMGGVMLAAGVALDRVRDGARDWGHWCHAMAAFTLAAIALRARGSEGLLAAVSASSLALAFWRMRVSYVLSTLIGAFLLTAQIARSGGPLGGGVAMLALLVSTVFVARRWVLRVAAREEDPRSIWG